MSSRGAYVVRGNYYKGEKWWIVADPKKGKEYHTHVRDRKAAEMIAIRAKQGTIPEHYPSWMVDSINRLWFGKDYLNSLDLNNTDLLTNNPTVRVKKGGKKKHGNKGYRNQPGKHCQPSNFGMDI
jgi:hypothetical protein